MASLHSSGWRVTVAERAWSYWSWMWLLESLIRRRTVALFNFHKLSFASKLLLQSGEVASFWSISKSFSDELLREAIIISYPARWPVSSWCGQWWLLQVPFSFLRSLGRFPNRCSGCASVRLSRTWGGLVVLCRPQQLVTAGIWGG